MKEILVIGAGAAGIMLRWLLPNRAPGYIYLKKMILSVRRWESPVKDAAT